MGAGKSMKQLESLDIVRGNRAVVCISEEVGDISILGSYNRITIAPVPHCYLHSLTVEGVSNRVRLERNTYLVEILGTDNSVTVAKGVAVERMRIQGEEVRWTSGKKDREEQGTEDGEV